MCKKHIKLLEENKTKVASINLSKKHLSYYLKGFDNSSYWRKKIVRSVSTDDMRIILENMKKDYL